MLLSQTKPGASISYLNRQTAKNAPKPEKKPDVEIHNGYKSQPYGKGE